MWVILAPFSFFETCRQVLLPRQGRCMWLMSLIPEVCNFPGYLLGNLLLTQKYHARQNAAALSFSKLLTRKIGAILGIFL